MSTRRDVGPAQQRLAAGQIGWLACCLTALLSLTSVAFAQKKGPLTPIEEMAGRNSGAAVKQRRFTIPDGVKVEDGLSEDEAVAIALWNNATLQSDLAALGFARADLVDAGLLRNPILSIVLPVGPYRQFESALTLPLEIFWQRRKRIEAATLEVTRIAKSLEQNALNLIRDVRIALADWLLAEERSRLATDAADVRGQIVQLTNVRLRVGDISDLEATTVRLDESLASEQAARFNREINITRDRLRQFLGMTGQAEPASELYPGLRPDLQLQPGDPQRVAASTAVMSDGPGSLDELLKTAYESRPDLRAATYGIETAAKRAKWEHSRIGALAGLLNLKQGEGVSFAPRPGVVLEPPIFNRNQGGIARADAEVERAAWHYLALRQRVAGEVQESLNQYRQARETLAIWEAQTVPLTVENARLARNSFTSGDQSYLFVLDAIRRLIEVRQREAELRTDVHRAEAQLDRSIGQQARRRVNARP